MSDRFILRAEAGTDIIRDYRDGIDKFVLAGGLGFADIAVVQQIATGSSLSKYQQRHG